MSQGRRVSIVVPLYNEEEIITRFYEEMARAMDELDERYRTSLLFVIDRSQDKTLEIAERLAARDRRVQVLALSSRFGHQMSLLAGIDNATDADAIIMMDGDLQHPPEVMRDLLAQYEAGAEVVSTVRKDPEGAPGRRLLVKAFYLVFGYLSDTPVTSNADFRLVSGRVASLLRSEIRERNMFLRGVFSWMGFRQVAVTYSGGKRAAGDSKYSLGRMMSLALSGLLAFSIKPLRVAILVGFAAAAFGFILGVITTIQYFVMDQIPSGWTTIVTLLVFFSGVQLIFIGVVGAYVGVIYQEVKGRPHYLIERRVNI